MSFFSRDEEWVMWAKQYQTLVDYARAHWSGRWVRYRRRAVYPPVEAWEEGLIDWVDLNGRVHVVSGYDQKGQAQYSVVRLEGIEVTFPSA